MRAQLMNKHQRRQGKPILINSEYTSFPLDKLKSTPSSEVHARVSKDYAETPSPLRVKFRMTKNLYLQATMLR